MKNTRTYQQHQQHTWLLRLLLLISSSVVLPGTALSRAARTGVLIHGCHLGAKGWRSIMWGNEQQQQLGRLPHGVRLAWEEDACVVVLGTGASEIDGVVEGRYALEYLKSNWDKLQDFDEAFSGVDMDEMRKAVQPLLVADVRSQNTRQELLEAGRIFRKENCDRVILVSSPTHLPRCLRDACSLWLDPPQRPPPRTEGAALTAEKGAENAETAGHGGQDNKGRCDEDGGGEEGRERGRRQRRRPRSWQPLVLASPSNTNYAGYGPGDVAIVEPPHRGDSDRSLGDGITAAGGNSCGPDSAPSTTVFRGNSRKGESKGKEAEADASEARDLSGAEEATTPSLLLHDLVALALKVGKSGDEGFRNELQALLRRYVNIRQ